MSVSLYLQQVVECTGRTAKSMLHPNRFRACPFETYPAAPAPFTMTSVAFPKSIFSELASNLPRHACRTGESITMSSKKSWLSVGITYFNGKISLTLLFLLLAVPAFASGGSCPSSASYLNSSGSLVTLSSLGVTSCYYIAANGSDSNNGTTEATPWLHAPGMPNCSGNCSTAYNGNLSGIGMIFRGGDTWHFGDNTKTPYTGGPWVTNQDATSAHPTYMGVDQSWSSGGSWTRPILTYDNPPNASQTLASCPIPTAGNMFDWSGGAYFILDNFEMTGVCTTAANWEVTYVSYGSLSGAANFYNLYIHGWSHVGFSNRNNCTLNNQCMAAFRGSVNSTNFPPGDTLLYDVVDGSDSDGVPMNFCYCGAWRVAFSYFDNGSQFITRSQNSFHDSAILNFVDNGHANVMESVGDAPGPSNSYAYYNNTFGNLYVNTTVNSNVGFWPSIPVGASLYWFNNIVYGAGPMEFFNAGLNGQAEGSLQIFNNTFQLNHRTDGGVDNISCSASGITMVNGNNHWISDDINSSGFPGTAYTGACVGQETDTNSLLMKNATATADGYTSTQTFVFSPTSASSPTVGAGSNRNSTFCSALATASSTDPYLTEAATACQGDTTYACSYSNSTNAVTCPGRTTNSRGSVWDIGSYEFNAQGAPPNPPTGLAAVVN